MLQGCRLFRSACLPTHPATQATPPSLLVCRAGWSCTVHTIHSLTTRTWTAGRGPSRALPAPAAAATSSSRRPAPAGAHLLLQRVCAAVAAHPVHVLPLFQWVQCLRSGYTLLARRGPEFMPGCTHPAGTLPLRRLPNRSTCCLAASTWTHQVPCQGGECAGLGLGSKYALLHLRWCSMPPSTPACLAARRRSAHAAPAALACRPTDRLLGMYLLSEQQSRRRQTHVLHALEAAGRRAVVFGVGWVCTCVLEGDGMAAAVTPGDSVRKVHQGCMHCMTMSCRPGAGPVVKWRCCPPTLRLSRCRGGAAAGQAGGGAPRVEAVCGGGAVGGAAAEAAGARPGAGRHPNTRLPCGGGVPKPGSRGLPAGNTWPPVGPGVSLLGRHAVAL